MDNKIIEKITSLEKQLYYIVKERLPQLKSELEEVIGGENDLSNLEEQINSNSQDIEEIGLQLSSISESISALSSRLSLAEGAVLNINSKITENESEINTLSSQVNTNNNNIATNIQNISQNAQNIQTNTQNISSNTLNIQSNATSISNLQETVSDNVSDISTLQENQNSLSGSITALTGRVQTLENAAPSSSGGVSVDVIYDMNSSDASINRGFTTGIPGSNNINWTERYDWIRIYSSLNNFACFVEVPMDNRPKNDITLLAIPTLGTSLYSLKCILYGNNGSTTKKLNISYSNNYTLNETGGTVTHTREYNSKNIITRIEGVKIN